MTEQELREKIIKALEKEIEYVVVCGSSVKNVCINHIADALIADGIGDVSEWKHRAEKTERALRNMASNYWGVEFRCLGAYDWEKCKKCKDKYILAYENEAVDCLVKVHLEQAENELQEKKDE